MTDVRHMTVEGRAPVHQVRVDDGDALMVEVPGASGHLVRTGRGHGATTIAVQDLGGVHVAGFDFGFPIIGNAGAHDDALVVCTHLVTPHGTRWEGSDILSGRSIAYLPGASHHATDPAGFQFGLVALPWEEVLAAAAALDLEPRVGDRIEIDSAALRSLYADGAATSAGGPAADGTSAEQIFDVVVRAVFASAPADRPPRRRWASTDLVDEVIGILERSLAWRIPVLSLCREVGVSERRLQQAFLDVFDIGPQQFMIQRALQAAHLSLERSTPTQASVASVAHDHGFHHGGRFASYYRATFGIPPGVTLRTPRP